MSLRDYAIGRGRQSPGANRGTSLQVTVISIDRVESAVRELLDVDKDRAIRSGLRAMGNALVTGGKKRLKVRLKDAKGAKGNLYNAFKVRVKKRKLGALAGFDSRGHHSHLVDGGTQKRYDKRGASRGVMPANSFWTDTAKEEWGNASERLFATIDRAVKRIIERNAY